MKDISKEMSFFSSAKMSQIFRNIAYFINKFINARFGNLI